MGNSALIITDGGLGSLLATFTAGPSTTPALPSDRSGASIREDTGEGVTTAWIALPADRAGEHAARLKAAELGAELSHIPHVVRWEHEAPSLHTITRHDDWRTAGSAMTAMLMAAGQEALRLGLCRVIWPIHLGRTDEHGRMLDSATSAIAEVMDRAAATARLLTLDGGPDGLIIQLPYVDFVDEQLADLAADLDLPLHACFLGTPGSPERARWDLLLTAYGASSSPPSIVSPRNRAFASSTR